MKYSLGRNCVSLWRIGVCTILIFFSIKVSGQVELSTGAPQITFPIFSFKNDAGLMAEAQLIYSGGNGLKVDELASDVGTGWDLDCGGSITRVVKDQPDDQKGGIFQNEKYANGFLHKPKHGIVTTIPQGLGYMPISYGGSFFYKHSLEVIEDKIQDEFVMQVNGRSVTFVIGYNKQITILDGANIKVELVEEDMFSQNILSTISKFIVTDESGVKYVFSDKSTQKIISYSGNGSKRVPLQPGTTSNFTDFISPGLWKENPYSVVDKWFLTEIRHQGGQQKISFLYDQYYYKYILGYSGSLTLENPNSGNRTYTQFATWAIGQSKRITKIVLPDNSVVDFSYADKERADLPGAKALTRIAILRDNIEVSGTSFAYNYFLDKEYKPYDTEFSTEEKEKARLCLSSAASIGRNGVLDKPYLFDYYNSGSVGGVPPRLTSTSDHYGYYTGYSLAPWTTDENIISNIKWFYEPAKRRPAPWVSTRQLGLIKSVTYPYGGKMEYVYDMIFRNNSGALGEASGVCVTKTITTDGIQANPPLVREYNYNADDGKPSLWSYEEPSYAETVRSHIAIPNKGTFNAGGLARDMFMPSLKLLNYHVQGSSAFAQSQVAKFSIYVYFAMSAITAIISNFTTPDRQEFDYVATQYSNGNAQRLNIPKPRFANATVYIGTTENNLGKEVFEFTTDKDFPQIAPTDKYSIRSRFIPKFYGLTKRKKIFTKDGEIVSDNFYHYTGWFKEIQDINNYSAIMDVKTTVSCVPADFDAQIPNVVAIIKPFYPLIGSPKLEYYVKKSYSGPSNFSITRTDYKYDDYGNLITETNTYPDGVKLENRHYYAYNYKIPGVLQAMVSKNMVNVPIASENWQISGGEPKLIGMDVAAMEQLDNGDIKIGKSYALNIKKPLSASVVGNFDGSVLNRVSAYCDIELQNVYDTDGRLVEVVAGGRMETNIFDDFGNNIIAKAYNASRNDVGYSSFETNAKGNWLITENGLGTAQETMMDAPTGESVLNLSKVLSVRKENLNPLTKYKLTYWKKSGDISISTNGGTSTSPLVLSDKNGWTLYSVEFTGTATIIISGAGKIDELRLVPIGGVIKSTTFNSQNLVSSMASEDNLVVYFEYDAFGVRVAERDADRNIIRSFRYEYKN
ncbi:hypothetical protein [Chitinophaga sp. sic0106]|uniref:hypothetical protein n=1 Tax=Chitinophaga sp. sic0106 TaxID=2854785 RepID=UPI001C48165B|nr:hypothetical protein [Chitinophaga sp. sic0106]MBV7530951.1 hypothetical protein [Chitinophaga sp. sic0106]